MPVNDNKEGRHSWLSLLTLIDYRASVMAEHPISGLCFD